MFKSTFFAMAVAVTVSGCANLSPAGLIAASRLDPLETAPADISIAISVPDALRLQNGDADFELSFLPDEDNPDQTVMTKVQLSLQADLAGPRHAEPGETIYVFGFSPKAASQLLGAQEDIKALRAQGIDGKGSLSVNISGGCLTRPLTDGLPVATWLRVAADAQYIPLTNKTDLLHVLDPDETDLLLQGFSPC